MAFAFARYGAFSVSAVYLQQFPSYSNHIAKNRHFYVPRPLFFCLPWGRPCGNHAKRCMNEKTIQCLPNPSQHVPIYLEQFPSYSNCKCKKLPFSRTAAHIFVSPADAPAIITQYVAWMERQFNACQTTRSMYPSIFNSFRVILSYPLLFILIYLQQFLSHFIIPPIIYHIMHSTPPLGGSRRNIGTPFGMEKLEWCRYPMVKKFRRYVYSF